MPTTEERLYQRAVAHLSRRNRRARQVTDWLDQMRTRGRRMPNPETRWMPGVAKSGGRYQDGAAYRFTGCIAYAISATQRPRGGVGSCDTDRPSGPTVVILDGDVGAEGLPGAILLPAEPDILSTFTSQQRQLIMLIRGPRPGPGSALRKDREAFDSWLRRNRTDIEELEARLKVVTLPDLLRVLDAAVRQFVNTNREGYNRALYYRLRTSPTLAYLLEQHRQWRDPVSARTDALRLPASVDAVQLMRHVKRHIRAELDEDDFTIYIDLVYTQPHEPERLDSTDALHILSELNVLTVQTFGSACAAMGSAFDALPTDQRSALIDRLLDSPPVQYLASRLDPEHDDEGNGVLGAIQALDPSPVTCSDPAPAVTAAFQTLQGTLGLAGRHLLGSLLPAFARDHAR